MHHGAHGKLKLFHLEDGGFNHQRDYKTIEELTLYHTDIQDNGIKSIANALEENNSLKYVGIV